jgi:hypothetical protein
LPSASKKKWPQGYLPCDHLRELESGKHMHPQVASRSIERFLAVTSMVVCLGTTAEIWQIFSPQQPMWPLPGLYLFEILLLTVAVVVVVVRDAGMGGSVIWGSVGALVAFVFMAALSVGLLYVPVIVMLIVVGTLYLRRRKERFPIHLVLGGAAALAQAALMLATIRTLYP